MLRTISEHGTSRWSARCTTPASKTSAPTTGSWSNAAGQTVVLDVADALVHQVIRQFGARRMVTLSSKNRKLRHLIVGLSLSLYSVGSAFGTGPRDILFDDKKLTTAFDDIDHMPYEELKSFAHAWAECNDALSDNAYIAHLCGAASEAYRLEFENSRSIDEILTTLEITREMIRVGDKVGKNKENGDLFLRYMKIRSSINKIITLRFYELRQPK
jgi:hypothetical protein